MTNTTRKFNLEDWSGDEVTVDYTDDGRFEFYGYQFQVGALENEGIDGTPNEGWRDLHGDQWSEPLTTLFFIDNDGDLESAVVKAVRYIANHV